MTRLRRLTLWAATALLAAGCETTTPPPPATWDTLQRVQTAGSGTLYLRPGPQARTYRTIVIDPLVIRPDEHWVPNADIRTGVVIGQHPVSDSEIQFIEETIGPAFREIFAKTLTAAGYQVTDRLGHDTLRVSAGLANVYIESVTTGTRLWNGDTMTIVMELSDPSTGQPLARLIDTKQGKFGFMAAPNTIVNNLDFQSAVQDWADQLLDALARMSAGPNLPKT